MSQHDTVNWPGEASSEMASLPVRQLRRSRSDHVVGGVCGGIGRYFNVDPVLLRIAAVALVLSGGVGILAYIIAWIVIPLEPGNEQQEVAGGPEHPSTNHHAAALVIGAVLVAVGGVLVANLIIPLFSGALFWPIVVMVVGVAILVSALHSAR